MEREIGSLEVGKKADVVLLDLRRPHLYPLNMPVFRLIYFANGNDVDTVIVDGRIALQRPQGAVRRRGLRARRRGAGDRADHCSSRARDLLRTPDTFWGHVRAIDQIRHH